MEQVEAARYGWPQAPYHTKTESDANYKRMVNFALRPENAVAVRVGIASHNLFDIAYALLLAKQRDVTDRVDFEMLEGMANSQAKEIRDRTGDMLVYCPVCYDADFNSAVAYLVRRFDENTQPGSFLGTLFGMQFSSPEWEQQSSLFLQACSLAEAPELTSTSHRSQDRNTEQILPTSADQVFQNAPTTDFSIPANRDWIRDLVECQRNKEMDLIPVQVRGAEFETDSRCEGRDPSRPGHVLYEYCRGNSEHVEHALQTAVQAQSGWHQLGSAARAKFFDDSPPSVQTNEVKRSA